MRRMAAVAAVLLATVAAGAVAQVADLAAQQATEVVGARKAIMGAIGVQSGLLRSAVRDGDLAAARTAAATLAALAGALPPLYAREHAEAYPVAGSRYRYAGGDVERLVAQIAALHAAARAAAQASSTAAIDVRAVTATCSRCHRSFRR